MGTVGRDPAQTAVVQVWYESREVARQRCSARTNPKLITGGKTAWFSPYDRTTEGSTFLRALWARAFGVAPGEPFDWFVSEHELPVTPEWREEIGLTDGCPDFACRSADRILNGLVLASRHGFPSAARPQPALPECAGSAGDASAVRWGGRARPAPGSLGCGGAAR